MPTEKTLIHYCALHCTHHIQRGASDALYTLAVYRMGPPPGLANPTPEYELWAYWGRRGHEQKATYKASGRELATGEAFDRMVAGQESKGYKIVEGGTVGTNTGYWSTAQDLGVPHVISTGMLPSGVDLGQPLPPGRQAWENALRAMAQELATEIGRSQSVVERAMRDAIDAAPGIALYTARNRAQIALQSVGTGNTGSGAAPLNRAPGNNAPRPMPQYDPDEGPIARAMREGSKAGSLAEAMATPIRGNSKKEREEQNRRLAEVELLRARIEELERLAAAAGGPTSADEAAARITRRITLED